MNKEGIIEKLKKIPIMGRISLVLAVLLLLSLFAFRTKSEKEGFTQARDFSMKEGSSIYDSFYASIYDRLVKNNVKNDYEIGEIINNTTPNESSVILDIGSGTGHHVGKLQEAGYNAYGIEKSSYMIDEAQNNYPSCKFVNGDALDSMIIPSESVTHILCLNYTIYNIKHKTAFFQNCFNWLVPGGYIAIHLVNKERFDPSSSVRNKQSILDIDRYGEERLMNTRTKIDDFDYKASFELSPDNVASYKESFTNRKTGKVRQNNHIYYMEPQKKILSMAQNAGFLLSSQINLFNVSYDYQFIYVLQKPN